MAEQKQNRCHWKAFGVEKLEPLAVRVSWRADYQRSLRHLRGVEKITAVQMEWTLQAQMLRMRSSSEKKTSAAAAVVMRSHRSWGSSDH
jgi:hypothetical protein